MASEFRYQYSIERRLSSHNKGNWEFSDKRVAPHKNNIMILRLTPPTKLRKRLNSQKMVSIIKKPCKAWLCVPSKKDEHQIRCQLGEF